MLEENQAVLEPVAEEWTEQDTKDFIQFGKYFVPHREMQFQTVATVIPELPDGSYIVDICCGEGHLCEYLLENIPNINILAMDGDADMLQQTAARLARFEGRFKTAQFDIFKDDWRTFDVPVGAFVSSLAVHHLDGPQKQQFYKDLASQIIDGGCFIIADLIRPEREEGKAIAALQWDKAVMERSLAFEGTLSGFEAFERTGWNSYRDPNFENDPVDKPSTLNEQMQWMRDAGLTNVDMYWMMAGHAIFGGYKA